MHKEKSDVSNINEQQNIPPHPHQDEGETVYIECGMNPHATRSTTTKEESGDDDNVLSVDTLDEIYDDPNDLKLDGSVNAASISNDWSDLLPSIDSVVALAESELDHDEEDDIISHYNSLKKRKLLKKAPDAPKRFKSAYICFVMDKMDDVRGSLTETFKVTDMMKMLAQKWNSLPREQKKVYEDIANADKDRYFSELSRYTGPMHVPNRRQKKPPVGAPKRAMSAFLSYSQQMRPLIRQTHPGLKNTDLSVVLAQKWRIATEEEKRPHIERELREREMYHNQMSRWKDEEKEKERLSKQQTNTLLSSAEVMLPGFSKVCPEDSILLQSTVESDIKPSSFLSTQNQHSNTDGGNIYFPNNLLSEQSSNNLNGNSNLNTTQRLNDISMASATYNIEMKFADDKKVMVTGSDWDTDKVSRGLADYVSFIDNQMENELEEANYNNSNNDSTSWKNSWSEFSNVNDSQYITQTSTNSENPPDTDDLKTDIPSDKAGGEMNKYANSFESFLKYSSSYYNALPSSLAFMRPPNSSSNQNTSSSLSALFGNEYVPVSSMLQNFQQQQHSQSSQRKKTSKGDDGSQPSNTTSSGSREHGTLQDSSVDKPKRKYTFINRNRRKVPTVEERRDNDTAISPPLPGSLSSSAMAKSDAEDFYRKNNFPLAPPLDVFMAFRQHQSQSDDPTGAKSTAELLSQYNKLLSQTVNETAAKGNNGNTAGDDDQSKIQPQSGNLHWLEQVRSTQHMVDQKKKLQQRTDYFQSLSTMSDRSNSDKTSHETASVYEGNYAEEHSYASNDSRTLNHPVKCNSDFQSFLNKTPALDAEENNRRGDHRALDSYFTGTATDREKTANSSELNLNPSFESKAPSTIPYPPLVLQNRSSYAQFDFDNFLLPVPPKASAPSKPAKAKHEVNGVEATALTSTDEKSRQQELLRVLLLQQQAIQKQTNQSEKSRTRQPRSGKAGQANKSSLMSQPPQLVTSICSNLSIQSTTQQQVKETTSSNPQRKKNRSTKVTESLKQGNLRTFSGLSNTIADYDDLVYGSKRDG
mmetsp:Transcript_9801/g.14621  ORF Transcript_9801/g.14621 Transcript_9801/m.14621 type:complete len:1038 (-) Transcript_9801:1840-4953(-)